jgi:F0F1-type ATP synthase membrane subunit a
MLFWGLSAFTTGLIWFDFPLLFPIIVYLQEILVSFIQAFVFPLLIAIFVKVAKIH